MQLKFNFLFTFIVLAGGATCQNDESNRRLEEFVNQTVSGLSNWMKENNMVPDNMEGHSRFNFKTYTVGFDGSTEMSGEMRNRKYFGHENNITANTITANLTSLTFFLDVSYGGSDDHITGEYAITSNTYGPSSGNFTRSIQTTNPLNWEGTYFLEVTPEGYFFLLGGTGWQTRPMFANLTLEGLDAGGYEDEVIPFIQSWYNMEFRDRPVTSFACFIYLANVFDATPIVDIIGEELPATITSEEVNKLGKPVIKSGKGRFLKGSKKWVDEISHGYVMNN